MFKKRVEYFKVKWKGIATEGNTWEPASHLDGDSSKAVLAAFRKSRADDRHKEDDAAHAKLVGNETGHVSNGRTETDVDNDVGDCDVVVVESGGPQKKSRQNRSDVWKFYYPRYWDHKGSSGKGYYAKCKLCQLVLKVSNTTNLRGHLDKRHAGEMVEEAQTGKQVSFYSLYLVLTVVDYLSGYIVLQLPLGPGKLLPDVDPETVMNKYQGETKKKFDREYVVWCCKSAKPLSMAENDKHFRRFCSSISCGRYTPPCKKVAAHELITLVAASREMIKAQIQEVLDVDCLDISISGNA